MCLLRAPAKGTGSAGWFGTVCIADLVWETLVNGSDLTWELEKMQRYVCLSFPGPTLKQTPAEHSAIPSGGTLWRLTSTENNLPFRYK